MAMGSIFFGGMGGMHIFGGPRALKCSCGTEFGPAAGTWVPSTVLTAEPWVLPEFQLPSHLTDKCMGLREFSTNSAELDSAKMCLQRLVLARLR